jgi:PPK2 family polyphosphate:nucleotide phosphotransferase
MEMTKKFVVQPGKKADLKRVDPAETLTYRDKEAAMAVVAENSKRLAELQHLLYASHEYAMLIVLQAMDAGGKDGTVRHVMSGTNPLGCSAKAFKVPSAEELDHDFLWRVHKAVPGRGEIGIFNRSHYEDVLIARVRKLVPKSVWTKRYEQINAFESILFENNVKILKFYLHISRDEQKRRLQQRLEDPTKHWKVNPSDFEERARWDEYMDAYDDALTRCSTRWAPWHIIPADKKWFRNLAVSQIIVETMERLNLKFPKPMIDVSQIQLK